MTKSTLLQSIKGYLNFMSKIYSLLIIHVFIQRYLRELMDVMFPSFTTCFPYPIYHQHDYSSRYHYNQHYKRKFERRTKIQRIKHEHQY